MIARKILTDFRIAACALVTVCGLSLVAYHSRIKADERPTTFEPVDSVIVSRIGDQYPMALSVSPDGAQVLLKTAKWKSDELSAVSAQTRQVIATTESKETQLALSWSPTGKEIAYIAAGGNGDIYRPFLWNLSDHSTRQIDGPPTGIAIQPPRWSFDGKQLAYLVGDYDDAAVWIVDVHSRGPARPLITHVRPRSGLEWSPDGQQMAIVFANSPASLHIIATDTGENLNAIQVGGVAGSEIRDMSWAPSGRSLAVAARVGHDFVELQRIDLAERKVTSCASAEGDAGAPHFAPDNRTILYSVSKESEVTLHSTRCDGSTPQSIGFNSGTTRFLRFLKMPSESAEHSLSFAALYNGLVEPPSLYKIPIHSGKPELVFFPANSHHLKSSPPEIINIHLPGGAVIPTVFWPRVKAAMTSDVVVVDVHGGPHLQAYRRWEFLPSLLASAGIDVLSPNYRGSSGYGSRYEQTGDATLKTQDIVAVCKYARSLHGGRARVILLGTSYGTYLAASTAVSDPQDISGLFLISLISGSAKHEQLNGSTFPIFCFHGENDPLTPEKAQAVFSSFFGENAVDASQNLWRVFPGEGHVFRHTHSWAEVYTAVFAMASRVSGRQLRCCKN